MRELYKDAKEFVFRHKAALIVNAVICVICYGHMAFSQNVGIDTEHVINHPGVSMQWETVGRQGLLYTKNLFGVINYNPYFNGALFLAGFILLGSMVSFLCFIVSGRNDKYPYGFFSVLFSTCPVWMMQFYFALQRAEVVLGMIYGVISVFALFQIVFLNQRKIYWFLICLLFGMWCFSSYQACAFLYISLCIICYLLDFFREPDRKMSVYFKKIAGLILGFGIVYLSYTFAVKPTLSNGWSIKGQMKWGVWPLSQNLALIFDHVKCLLNWYRPDNVSAYPLALICVSLLFCLYVFKSKKNSVPLFLGLAGLLIAPFLMSIYIGNKALGRSQSALPVVAAFACMLFWGFLSTWEEKKLRILKWVSMFAGGIMVWAGMAVILAFVYTDDIRYRDDVNTARMIASDLYQTEGYRELPVIFVGEKDAELNGACLEADLYGYSFFKWDYSDGNPTGATWRILGFMNTLGIELEDGSRFSEKALKAAENMPYFPQKGYISVQDKYVVIKLSEVPSSKSRKPRKSQDSWKLWHFRKN